MKILLAFTFGLFAMINYNHFDNNKNTKKIIESFDTSYAPLQGTHWKLIELSNTIVPENATPKEMYFILKNDSTVSGNGGCNTFSGRYSFAKKNQISFGEMVRTNIFCQGIDFERKFLNALSKVDHYNIKGDTLSLQEQLVNLAKFVAVKKQ